MGAISWQACVVIGLSVLGGVGCYYLGFAEAGMLLVGAAVGLVPPLSMIKPKAVVEAAGAAKRASVAPAEPK